MAMLQRVWKQHLRPRAVVGYGVKIFLPSLPNYVIRSPGSYAMGRQYFAIRVQQSVTPLRLYVFAFEVEKSMPSRRIFD